jgi:hypothetical protein
MRTPETGRRAGRLLVVAGLLWLGLATAAPAGAAEQHLKFALDDSWTLASRQSDPVRQVRSMEFVRRGQSLDAWTGLVTMQNFGRARMKLRPEALMKQPEAQMRQRCSTLTWTVIGRRADGLVYEWRIANCAPHPDHSEIARIVQAKMNTWRLSHTRKAAELTPAQRQQWLDWPGGATLYER